MLVVGGGGREHALVRALAPVARTTAHPLRARATRASPPTPRSSPCAPTTSAASSPSPPAYGVDLVVVGPEAPLVAGVCDALRAAGLRAFGPSGRGRAPGGQQGVRQGGHGRRRRADRARGDRDRRGRGHGGRRRPRPAGRGQGRRPGRRQGRRGRRHRGRGARGAGGLPGGGRLRRGRARRGGGGGPDRARGVAARDLRRPGAGALPGGPRLQADRRGQHRPQHRRHGLGLARAGHPGRAGRRAARPGAPAGGGGDGAPRRAVLGRALRRPDDDRGRAAGAGVQHPLRRPRDPGAAAALGGRRAGRADGGGRRGAWRTGRCP